MELDLYNRIRLLGGELYHSAGIGSWCYAWEGTFFYAISDNQEEYQKLLQFSGLLPRVAAYPGGLHAPCITTDTLGAVWIFEHTFSPEGKPELIFVLGPMLNNAFSMADLDRRLRSREALPAGTAWLSRPALREIPLVSRKSVHRFARMLHYMITEEGIEDSAFISLSSAPVDSVPEDWQFQETPADPSAQIRREKETMHSIAHGTLTPDMFESRNDTGATAMTDTGNFLRDTKNTLLIYGALCYRAAMDGGVSPALAMAEQKDYLTRLERCDNVEALLSMHAEMIQSCVRLVRDASPDAGISRSVRDCMDFIRANKTADLTTRSVAEHMGYAEYYFTKKFYKETGIRLPDYIKQVKIEYAKILLLTTDRQLQEVGEMLGFSSRSAFSTAFRQSTGVTPSRFREQAGIRNESED